MKPNIKQMLVAAVGTMALLAAGSAPSSAATTATQTIYASPTGSGTSCSQSAPCDITTAQSTVRSKVASAPGDTVNVLLSGGTYRLNSPLNFTSKDAGTGGVNWQAAPGQSPVLSGAVAVQNWTVADAAKNIYVADVPADLNTRQLYINGERAPIAQTTPAEQGFSVTGGSGTGFTTSNTWAANLAAKVSAANLTRVEMVYRGGNGPWTEPRCRIQSASGNTVTMQQPCWRNTTARNSFNDASGGLPSMGTGNPPTSIENSYQFLHQGQWYLDFDTHKLYYQARPGTNMSALQVEAPRLERVMQVQGTLDAPVQNLNFKGITFTGATWLDPSRQVGFAEVQDNLRITGNDPNTPQALCTFGNPPGTCPFGSLTRPEGNVVLTAARNVSITDSTFTHLGGAGLIVENGSSNVTLTGNTFTDISSNALIIGNTIDPNPSDVGESDRQITHHITFSNNVVHDVGAEYHGSAGVTLFFARNLTITHNHLYDLPYTGISAGVVQGHVDDADHPDNSTNVNSDNTISNNLIHQVMQVLNDGGAIYVEGHQGQYVRAADGSVDRAQSVAHGLQAVNNVAYNMGTSNFTYYDDAGAQWINWSGNVSWTGDHAQGGCSPVGRLDYVNNWQAKPTGYFPCKAPIDVSIINNVDIPVNPTTDNVPANKFSESGLEPTYAQRQISQPARVDYAQRQANGTYFVAGVNFTSGTTVLFDTGQASAVTLLGGGFLIATPPAGSTPGAVGVTQAGSSSTYAFNDLNLAYHATVKSSSVYNDDPQFSPTKLVDGISSSLTTTKNSTQPWYTIDLGSMRSIKELQVYNRTDCCTDRLKNYHLVVSQTPFTSDALADNINKPYSWVNAQTAQAGTPTIVPVGGARGRYVLVQLDGTGELGLGELKVITQ